MAWSSPPTFTSGNVLTAAQLNTLSADLNETAPAKATTGGQMFVSTGANSIAARTPTYANISGGDQNTGSTSFVDLLTAGPSVTITTGTFAIVMYGAVLFSDTAAGYAEMTWQCSGATTIAAGTYATLRNVNESFANARMSFSKINFVAGLSSGSNTFTAKYRSLNTGTAIFNQRELMVLPTN